MACESLTGECGVRWVLWTLCDMRGSEGWAAWRVMAAGGAKAAYLVL